MAFKSERAVPGDRSNPEDDLIEAVVSRQEAAHRSRQEAAHRFLEDMLLTPTPDALDQLLEVFVPCLEIMCERGYDPNGGTWRTSGVLGILGDVRKKFERLWERAWRRGERHDDSALDLINYLGMYLRSENNGWGDWGDPHQNAGKR